MKQHLSSSLRQALIVAVAVASLSGAGFVFAAPTAPPPGSSIALPLTRGATAETKTGALTLQGGLSVSGGSGLCLNGVCKTSWPSSTVQAGTTTATGQANVTINSYDYTTGNLTYYYYSYGSEYSYNNYTYYKDYTFSVTASVPGGVPISMNGTPTVRCYVSNSSYNYTPAPQTYPYSSSNYTYATNISASFDASNNIIVSGSCKLYLVNGYYNTNYFAIPVTVSVRYLY